MQRGVADLLLIALLQRHICHQPQRLGGRQHGAGEIDPNQLAALATHLKLGPEVLTALHRWIRRRERLVRRVIDMQQPRRMAD